MGYKPLSLRVKKNKASQVNDIQLHKAAAAYQSAEESGKKLIFCKVAEMFPGVSKSILEQFITGKGKTMQKFNAAKQKLTVLEENVLVEFILESAN